MNLITCWSCGVILNKDALNFPEVYDDNDDLIPGTYEFDDFDIIRLIDCPICKKPVREDGRNS